MLFISTHVYYGLIYKCTVGCFNCVDTENKPFGLQYYDDIIIIAF